jgi:hypothetical protein
MDSIRIGVNINIPTAMLTECMRIAPPTAVNAENLMDIVD